MSSSGKLVVCPPSEYWVTYSADVSIPSRSVSTETPCQTVSSFDHLVTQWMSRVISSLDRARNSSQLQPRGSSSSPMIEKSHSSSEVCGVGPADRPGKSRVTYWPGGTRAGSASAARRPRNPRETYVVRSRSTSLGGTPVLPFVLVCEVGVCVGVVVDIECQVALRSDLEVGAVALVPDADDELVERGVPVERHVDAGTGASR